MNIRLAGALAMAVCASATAHEPEGIRQDYHKFAAAGDLDRLVALWREHPGDALGTIDADLEGSLKMIEQGKSQTDPEVVAMRRRARFGALAADKAFGSVIFSDYATSFAGWNKAQSERFRSGQKAHGESRKALGAGDTSKALAAGQACIELAHPLGDWWGTAMGWGDIAMAHEARGEMVEAIAAHSTAHMIYHDLKLFSGVQRHAAAQARLLDKQGNVDRAVVAAESALRAAQARNDSKGIAELTELRTRLKGKQSG